MKKIIILLFISTFLILTVPVVSAAAQSNPKLFTLLATPGTVSLPNPLGKGKTDIPTLLGNVINSVLGIIGSLALVMFIYGGIIWMTSSGNAEQVTKGKNIIIWATIGLVVIFSAYALVNFVLTKALGVT